jgi:hypothetical protein
MKLSGVMSHTIFMKQLTTEFGFTGITIYKFMHSSNQCIGLSMIVGLRLISINKAKLY